VSYSSAAQIRDAFKSFFITCCSCNAVFSDQEEFSEHDCKSHVDEELEKSLCTGCKPVSLPEPEKIFDKAQERSQSMEESFGINTDDETERTDVPDVNEESITADSTLNVIGASEQCIVPSLAEKIEIAETASASDVHADEIMKEDVHKEIINSDEKMHQTPILKNEGSETGSPTPILSDDAIKMECDDRIPSVVEPVKNLSPQHLNEFSDAAPSMNEGQEDEAVANEDIAASIIEEKNKWLESDDEMKNVAEPPTENEVAPPNFEPCEPPPQPVAMALMLDETVASLSVRTLVKECVRTNRT
jgi:hypothetical protein